MDWLIKILIQLGKEIGKALLEALGGEVIARVAKWLVDRAEDGIRWLWELLFGDEGLATA